jgi:hypothetical protein
MRRRLGTVLAAAALAGIAACASAPPKTKVGWDQNVSFAGYHTWAWRPDGSISDATWARRCQDVLSDQLQSDGLKQVGLDQNPDLWGVIHAKMSAEQVVVPYASDWGYAWGGWAPIEDYQEDIAVGTIIVDLVDVKLKHIVWRGSAKGAIDPTLSNEGREEKLRKVLAQLFAGYPPATSPRAAAAPTPAAGR